MNEDLRHLELLSIFHYVVAALTALVGLFPFIHLAVGIAILSGAFDSGHDPPPRFVGLIFVVMAVIFIVCAWSMAVAIFIAARRIKAHQHHLYCVVVAAIECIFMPFGTILGVFTLIVLMRPSVKQLFESKRAESW